MAVITRPEQLVCEDCGVQCAFNTAWSDDDAQAEYEKLFQETSKDDERVVLCDSCYKKFLGCEERRH